MKGVSITVILRSCSEGRVRVAMMAGTLQPNPTSIGTKLRPDRPKRRSTLSITKATRAMYPESSSIESSRKSTTMSGQEREHAAHAREHAVDHERLHHRVHARGRERGGDGVRDPRDALLHEALQPGAEPAEGDPEHESHDEQERGERREAPREDAVDGDRALVLAALAGLDHAGAAHGPDEREAHVGERGEAVGARLLLHLRDDVLERVELVGVKPESAAHELVALDQLGRGEAQRDPGVLGVVLDEVHDGMDAAVQRALVGAVRSAEVLPARQLAMARDVQHVLDQLGRPLVLGRGDGHRRGCRASARAG